MGQKRAGSAKQKKTQDTAAQPSADTLPPSIARDARLVRTDLALRKAFLALLERKSLDQITIREITAKAGVHYATFFRHHETKEALLDHVAADQIDRLVELTVPILDTNDSLTAFVVLCTHVSDHRKLWTTLLTGGAAAALRAEYLRVSRIVASERASKDLEVPVDLAVVCTVSLILDTLAWWLAQPRDAYSIRQIAAILDRIVPMFGARVSS